MDDTCRLRDATWLLGDTEDDLPRWARQQIQLWVTELSGAAPRFAPTVDAAVSIVVGTPASNRLISQAVEQGLIELSSLGADDSVLKQTVFDHEPVLLIAGRAIRAAVYGVCELFERLGCTFLISGRSFPARRCREAPAGARRNGPHRLHLARHLIRRLLLRRECHVLAAGLGSDV